MTAGRRVCCMEIHPLLKLLVFKECGAKLRIKTGSQASSETIALGPPIYRPVS